MQIIRSIKKYYIFSFISLFICLFVLSSCISNNFASESANSDAIKNIYIEYQNIADTFFSQEKYDKAASYYKLALENKDTYWNVYYKLAKTLVMQKSWNEAEEMFKTLQKRDPENLTLKVSLAYIYSMNNKVEDAKLIYEELISLFPEVKEYIENYISILILQKNFDEVIINLEAYKEKFPDSTNISLFEKEYDKYIQEQKELYPEKFADEAESNLSESESTNTENQPEKNPEESNLEIENINDE